MEMEYNTEKAIKAQSEHCDKVGTIMFAPGYDGRCYHCGRNIYQRIERNGWIYGYSVEEAGKTVITDCPHCHYSFVD